MTWAEFQLRAYSYQRQEKRKDLRAREIAWSSLIAPNADAKKLPRSKNKFWQIGDEQESKMSDRMRERIINAQNKYKEEINGVR